jgi:integrase
VAVKAEEFVWSLTKADDAVSATTAAYVGKHARGFTRWLWRKRKLLDNDPLAGVDLPSQETGRPPRALTAEELDTLIRTAGESPKEFRGLAGPDRALLYLTAASTGFRSGELAALATASFDLAADVPVARLRGKHTKNKKNAEQPLRPALTARLEAYLPGRPADAPVWPGTWAKRG